MNGGRLVPGNLQVQPGRELRCLFDEQGRVYKPHPYDLPASPMEVTAFALNMVLTAIDTNHLTVEGTHGHFVSADQRARYRAETENLLRSLECRNHPQYFHSGNETQKT